jgi:uncharacterized protein YjeT (DUF2065 family)
MARIFALALGLFLGGNGLVMMIAPEPWYQSVPGVTETGPFNIHFVMDIGAGFVVTGTGFLWLVVDPARGWPAALIGTAFVTLHALIHLIEAVAGHGMHGVVQDLAGVYLPAAGALAVTWALRPLEAEAVPC